MSINLTPDSFYAPSRVRNVSELIHSAQMAIEAGADILDLGAESTRPGATPVSPVEELTRLLSGLRLLRRMFPELFSRWLTRHAETARAALAAGADVINDVTGLGVRKWGRSLPRVGVGPYWCIFEVSLPLCIGYHRWKIRSETVSDGFAEMLRRAKSAGIANDQVVLDPGFGLAKISTKISPS